MSCSPEEWRIPTWDQCLLAMQHSFRAKKSSLVAIAKGFGFDLIQAHDLPQTILAQNGSALGER
jgi:hypothetical protein